MADYRKNEDFRMRSRQNNFGSGRLQEQQFRNESNLFFELDQMEVTPLEKDRQIKKYRQRCQSACEIGNPEDQITDRNYEGQGSKRGISGAGHDFKFTDGRYLDEGNKNLKSLISKQSLMEDIKSYNRGLNSSLKKLTSTIYNQNFQYEKQNFNPTYQTQNTLLSRNDPDREADLSINNQYMTIDNVKELKRARMANLKPENMNLTMNIGSSTQNQNQTLRQQPYQYQKKYQLLNSAATEKKHFLFNQYSPTNGGLTQELNSQTLDYNEINNGRGAINDNFYGNLNGFRNKITNENININNKNIDETIIENKNQIRQLKNLMLLEGLDRDRGKIIQSRNLNYRPKNQDLYQVENSEIIESQQQGYMSSRNENRKFQFINQNEQINNQYETIPMQNNNGNDLQPDSQNLKSNRSTSNNDFYVNLNSNQRVQGGNNNTTKSNGGKNIITIFPKLRDLSSDNAMQQQQRNSYQLNKVNYDRIRQLSQPQTPSQRQENGNQTERQNFYKTNAYQFNRGSSQSPQSNTYRQVNNTKNIQGLGSLEQRYTQPMYPSNKLKVKSYNQFQDDSMTTNSNIVVKAMNQQYNDNPHQMKVKNNLQKYGSMMNPIRENDLERNESNVMKGQQVQKMDLIINIYKKNIDQFTDQDTSTTNGRIEPHEIQGIKKVQDQILNLARQGTAQPQRRKQLKTQMLQNFQISVSQNGRSFNINSILEYGFYPDTFFKKKIITQTYNKFSKEIKLNWTFEGFYPKSTPSKSREILEAEKRLGNNLRSETPSTAQSSSYDFKGFYILPIENKENIKLNYKYLKGPENCFIFFPLYDSKFNYKDILELQLLNMFKEIYQNDEIRNQNNLQPTVNSRTNNNNYNNGNYSGNNSRNLDRELNIKEVIDDRNPSVNLIEKPIALQGDNLENIDIWFQTEIFIVLEDILQHRFQTNNYWQEAEILYMMQSLIGCLVELNKFSLSHLGLCLDRIVYCPDSQKYKLIGLHCCLVNHPQNFKGYLNSKSSESLYNIYLPPEVGKISTLKGTVPQENKNNRYSNLIDNEGSNLEEKFNFLIENSILTRSQRYSLGICFLIIKYVIPAADRTHDGIQGKLYALQEEQCLSAKIIKFLIDDNPEKRMSTTLESMLALIQQELRRPAKEDEILPMVYLGKMNLNEEQHQQKLALQYQQTFQYSRALQILDNLSSIKEARFGDRSPEYLQTLKDRWVTLYNMGRYEEAYAFNQKWEILCNNHKNMSISADDHQSSGEVKWMVGEMAQARKDFEIAQKQRFAEFGDTSQRVVQGRLKTGIFFYNHNAFDDAIVGCQGALTLLKTKTKTLNLDLYLDSMEYLAFSLLQAEKLDQSLDVFNRVYQIKSNQNSEDSVSLGLTAYNIAQIYFNQAEYTKAQTYLKEALTLCETPLGREDHNVHKIKELYGFVLLQLGEKNQALPIFNEILDRIERNRIDPQSQEGNQIFQLTNYFDSLSILAQTAGYMQLNGEDEEALRIYERCRVISVSLFTEQNQFSKQILAKIQNLKIQQQQTTREQQLFIEEALQKELNMNASTELQRRSERIQDEEDFNQYNQFPSENNDQRNLQYPLYSSPKSEIIKNEVQITNNNNASRNNNGTAWSNKEPVRADDLLTSQLLKEQLEQSNFIQKQIDQKSKQTNKQN